MSERSEMEHAVARRRLPSKTDLEKKIEIATFFSRTQHLFIRLEALVKWSNSASKVDKCEVTVTLMSEALDFPWRILDLKFLLKDSSMNAFSLSLQLDMLHEQAQRARSKRPPDQLTIEAYRPSRCLSISYWHGLARTQYNSVMGLDGKLYATAYLLTIHVDPTEPQRPLCVSHRPELTTSKSQLVGATVQGDCLSIETLLTRTMVARAEQMLQVNNLIFY
ncbi:unnamed protein product [Schistosoma mattheei]|uniref:Mediator of RNA polymerase II transcription subunit 14 n=1 Tax=Schistosoma mattheei TaxID=31246 RepID=A0A183NYC5_9TREM|nr:unnamed protein product [Schistosoma mattheei]